MATPIPLSPCLSFRCVSGGGSMKKFCLRQCSTLPRSGPRAVHSASCGLSLLLQPPAYPLVLSEDVTRAQTCPHQGEPLVRLLLHWEWHPLWVVPADNHVHWSRPLADRCTHKTSSYITSSYKTSSYQTSSYRTSRIQNVQDTKRPVTKRPVTERPGYKTSRTQNVQFFCKFKNLFKKT
jgi:hypothetical protein